MLFVGRTGNLDLVEQKRIFECQEGKTENNVDHIWEIADNQGCQIEGPNFNVAFHVERKIENYVKKDRLG